MVKAGTCSWWVTGAVGRHSLQVKFVLHEEAWEIRARTATADVSNAMYNSAGSVDSRSVGLGVLLKHPARKSGSWPILNIIPMGSCLAAWKETPC